MESFNAEKHSHRRYNPLLREWVLVSPHRTQRPWQGAQESIGGPQRPEFDPQCYLCPGNTRANGETNPAYPTTFVFRNDYAALRDDVPAEPNAAAGLFQASPARGECRVLCFSPRHDLTLATLPAPVLRNVIDLWADQSAELGQTYRWVQIFENRGEAMGASNPHPHGQVWATDYVPSLVQRELDAQAEYFLETGDNLLLQYAAQESAAKSRSVYETSGWIVVVPFWATWPFETMVLPKFPVGRLEELRDQAREELVEALGVLLRAYDRLFDTPFPYSMGWHGNPYPDPVPGAQLHAHFLPPLLRSATVRKFMVGFELLAESQRDLTPELAAERIRGMISG